MNKIALFFCTTVLVVPALARAQSLPLQSISQREAISQALAQNPTLSALVAQQKQASFSVDGEEDRYQFVVAADGRFSQSHTPRLQAGNELTSNKTRDFLVGAELRRQFAWGTVLALRVEERHFQNAFGGGYDNPILNQSNGFGSTAKLILTQPLLRGFGTKIGEVELRAAQASLTQADKARLRGASELIQDTMLAYAELWYATRALEIEKASLALAEAQEKDAQARVRTGSSAPADVLSFSSQVAERRESVVAAEGELQNRTIALLRLTGEPHREGLLAAINEPARLGTPSSLELEQALEEDSIELAELKAQVKTAQIRSEVAGESLRPLLDLRGTVSTTGLGEDAGSALSRAGAFNWMTAEVTVLFESPVGSARKEAERAEAAQAVIVAQENLRAARDRIRSEVRTSEVGVYSAARNLELAQKTRDIAEQTLEAEQQRYATGSGVSLQVQQADDSVRRARLRETRARVDLASAEIKLQHLSGGLIKQAEAESLL